MKTILFVCTGNTCRSPLAEVLANQLLCREGKDTEFIAESAGLCAVSGSAASEHSKTAAETFGCSLQHHFARQLIPDMAEHAFRIYTMTQGQAQFLKQAIPEAAEKIEPLSDTEIEDPYGEDLPCYLRCGEQIKDAVTKKLERLWN